MIKADADNNLIAIEGYKNILAAELQGIIVSLMESGDFTDQDITTVLAFALAEYAHGGGKVSTMHEKTAESIYQLMKSLEKYSKEAMN